MIPMTLTVALILPVLLTTTEIAQAAENRYGMRAAPSHNATMVVLTEYSVEDGEAEPYPVDITHIGRVLASKTGVTTVAYDLGAFHVLDGPENVLVESAIADVVVTTRGVRWMEFPAQIDTEPPLVIPSPAARRPMSVCYQIRRAVGSIMEKEIETTDAFGTQRLVIGRPESLCVPGNVAVPGDPYYYYPAYGVPFPPVPPGPTRLCFKVRPERPALRPPPVAVATFFGDAVATLEPVREHCVEATITPGTQEEH
jgi:hypothetical protein